MQAIFLLQLDPYPLVNEHSYGKSPSLVGKSTMNGPLFNSYVSHYPRVVANRDCVHILSPNYCVLTYCTWFLCFLEPKSAYWSHFGHHTLRFHQTWLAGKWTIEIGDFPIKTKPPFNSGNFPLPCLISGGISETVNHHKPPKYSNLIGNLSRKSGAKIWINPWPGRHFHVECRRCRREQCAIL